jgi:hypothetical protein
LHAKSLSVVREIVKKTLDPKTFACDGQTFYDSATTLRGRWFAVDIGAGFPGPAMLHSAFAAHSGDSGRPIVSHRYLERILSSGGSSISLYGGWGGVIAAFRYCSQKGVYYKGALLALSSELRKQWTHRVLELKVPPRNSFDYDLIAGVAGGVIALGSDAPQEAIAYLGELAANKDNLNVLTGGREDLGPQLNLGLSHGLPGILVALCVSSNPHEYVDEKSNIVKFLLQVASSVSPRRWGTAWQNNTMSNYGVGWCYGTSGIACALWLAGRHLRMPAVCQTAVDILVSDAGPTITSLEYLDYSLCHGAAGIALCYGLVGKLACRDDLKVTAERVIERIVRDFDTNLTYGYKVHLLDERLESNGFLLGSTGIAMTLLTLMGDVDDSWATLALGLPSSLTELA